MARVLTIVGLLVLLLFVGIAAAPLLIDWNRHKGFVEREASRLLGLPVVVDGRMEARLVPTPFLVLEGVRVGNRGGEARVGSVQLELSLASLLKGELHVTEVRISEPQVWVTIDAQGRLVAPAPALDLAAQVERIEVDGGQFTLDDAREGTRLFVDQLGFAGEATTLAGPWRLEGGGRFEGRRAAFTLSTGRAEAGSVRLRLQLDPVDTAVAADMEGAVTLGERRPAFNGTLRLRGIGAADAASRDTGWRADAQVDLRPDSLHAREIRVIPGTEERLIQLTGTVAMMLGARPRFDAALSTRQLDLDRLAESGPEASVDLASTLANLGALSAAGMLPAWDGDVSLDVGSVVLVGGLVQDASVRLETRDGRWRLERIEARLPGQGQVKASGSLGLRGGPPLFDGLAELSVRAPSAFANWVEGELLRTRQQQPAQRPAAAPPLPGAAAALSFSGRLAVGADRIAAESLNVAVGPATMTGRVEYATAVRRLSMRLSAAEIDIDPVVQLVNAFGPRLQRANVDAVEAELRSDRLRYRALDVRGLDVALRAGAEGVVADRIAAELNGVRLDGSGRIDTEAGALRLQLRGDRLSPLFAALEGAFGTHPALTMLAARADALAPAALDATVTRQGSDIAVAVAGTANSTRVEGGLALAVPDLSSPAALDRLNVTLQSPRTDGLLRQLGLDALPLAGDRGARLTATLDRRDPGAHRLTADADLSGTRVSLAGAVALDPPRASGQGLAAALSSPDIAPLLLSLGMPAMGLDERAPVSLRARVVAAGDGVQLEAIDGSVRGEPVRGTLRLLPSTPWQAGGRLELGEVSAERLATLAFGLWPVPAAGESWSGAAFGPRPVPPLSGDVAIAIRRLDVERLAVDGMSLVLRFEGDRLVVQDIAGALAGGRLSGTATIARGDAGTRAAIRLVLDGARAEDLLWARSGRPTATGRIDGRIELEGSGRSPSVLVGSLAGEGAVTLGAGELRGIAAGGFAAGTRAGEAGLEVSEAQLAELVRAEMDAGVLPFTRLEAALSVQAGVVRAANLALDGAPVATTGRFAVNLPRWSVEGEATLEGEAPRRGQRGPRVGLVFSGPIEAPERRIDVKPFVDFLNLRRFEREVERLEALQRDIEQRERLMRELEDQERERRARSAPAAPEPAPAPPAAETPRQGASSEDARRLDGLVRDALRDPAIGRAPPPLPPPQRLGPTPGSAPLPLLPR